MTLLEAELVRHVNGKSTIRCTWRLHHPWWERLLVRGPMPKYEVVVETYVGHSTVWREADLYVRLPTNMESMLCDIEFKFLEARSMSREDIARLAQEPSR